MRVTRRTTGLAGAVLLLLVGQWSLGSPAKDEQQPSSASAAGPTTRPATVRAFQPGVSIDWQTPAVHVETEVVFRSGPLEFLACFPGKEHESILRFRASATHIFMALGLVGLESGRPPRWNEAAGRFDDPQGDPLDIRLEWEEDGEQRSADAYDWLRLIELGTSPLPRPWVFGGSLVLEDGTLMADRSGVGVALVDFADALISYSRRYPSNLAKLWAEVYEPRVPPLGTEVTMIITAARPRPLAVRVDAMGLVWVNTRYATPADLADLLRGAGRLSPDSGLVEIVLDGTLVADETVLRRILAESDVTDEMVRWRRIAPPALGGG